MPFKAFLKSILKRDRNGATALSSAIARIPPASLIAARLIIPGISSDLQPPDDEAPSHRPLITVSSADPLVSQLTISKISSDLLASDDKAPSRRPSIAASRADSLLGDNNDLWVQAYALAKKREEELMDDYERHIHVASLKDAPAATKSFSDPHDVEFYVNHLLDIRKKKKIQVSILGHDVTMREQIEKLAKFLIWSDSIVKAAASTQPYAALAWSGASLFLPLLISGTRYNDNMLTGFNSISDMQIFWKSCEEIYFTPSNMTLYNKLKDPLIKLYSFIIAYQARTICHLSKAQLSRAWQSMTGSDDWAGAIKSIKELEDRCLSLVDNAHKDGIQNKMDNQLQEIQRLRIEFLQAMKEEKEDGKERKLLGDLAKMSGDYERYKNLNPERVPRTCEWFLTDERFHKWRDSKSGDLLWVSAGPGCGKSVLSKSLIDERHLSPETVTISSSTITVSESVICYFFFKEGGEGKMDSAHALCAILHQLFSQKPQLITHALSSHKLYGQDLVQRTDELWRILVDCANLSAVPIVCLLDALDECNKDGRNSLINKLYELYRQTNVLSIPLKLKFLITSRPYETLQIAFDKFIASSAYLHINGDDKSEQIGREIDLVIDHKVALITDGFSPEDRDKISQYLKSMDNRTYLWLHLTLNIIEQNSSAYSRRLDLEKFLSTLPSAVSDAYEKILSKSQDERMVEALLQIVLAARRPLTLDEANYALTLALGDEFSSHEELQENLSLGKLQESLWPQDRFKTMPGNLCGLFISIHDSKLSFIHQTAREFLLHPEQSGTWKGRLNALRSHGILSKACLNYLLIADTPNTTRAIRRLEGPFLSYAANSWLSHFNSQDSGSTDRYLKLARALCRVSAPQTRNWIKSHKISNSMGINWDQWPDFQLAVHFNLAAVVRDMMTHEHPDINGEFRRFYAHRTPLCTAIQQSSFEVMKILLESDSGVRVGRFDIVTALELSEPSAILTLLLDKRGNEIKITEDELVVAVSNFYGGAEATDLLLKKRPDEAKVTQNVLKRAVQGGSIKTLSLLLDARGSKINITEDVMLATVNTSRGIEMLSLLLEQCPHEIKVESLVIAAMKEASVDWITVLLNKRGHDINITKDMVKAALGLAKYVQMATFFLDKRGNEMKITEDIVEAASGNREMGLQMVTLLLDKYGEEFKITQDIVKAAASSGDSKLITLLLNRRGHEFKITEDIVESAVRCDYYWASDLMTLLLNKRGHEFKITQDIIKAAASNDDDMLVTLLLEERGHEFKITEEVAEAATRCDYYWALDLTTLLLNKRGHEFKITQDIIKSAAINGHPKLVSLLLDERGHEFKITEDVVEAATRSFFYALEIITLFLDKRGHEFKITEDIVESAARSGYKVSGIITLFLNKRGHEFKITEGIVQAASDNSQLGKKMVALLKDRRRREMDVSEDSAKILG